MLGGAGTSDGGVVLSGEPTVELVKLVATLVDVALGLHHSLTDALSGGVGLVCGEAGDVGEELSVEVGERVVGEDGAYATAEGFCVLVEEILGDGVGRGGDRRDDGVDVLLGEEPIGGTLSDEEARGALQEVGGVGDVVEDVEG